MTQGRRITFGPFSLDPEEGRLRRGTKEIVLRPKACAVLLHLVERAGQLVSKEDLIRAVWPGVAVTDTVLKVCIREIRKALDEKATLPEFIETLPRRGYRFVAKAAEVTAPPPTAAPDALANVVDREKELAQLATWLAQADGGERKVVFVTGEPGVGKTTLIDLFLSRAAVHERMRIGRGQCLERYGQGEAYLPILEALGRLCREPGGERLTALLRQFAPSWLAQMPALVADEELAQLQRRVQGTTHERMLREVTEAIEAFAAEKGFALILDDLQWSDYSTLELIAYLAHLRQRIRLMVIGTYRPAEVALANHPLHGVKQELLAHGHCEEIELQRLSEHEVAEYVMRRLGEGPRQRRLGHIIYDRTEGNPLFMVNLVKYAIAHDLTGAAAGEDATEAATSALEQTLPESLRQIIEKQIDALGAATLPLLEVASVVGVTFAAAAVAAGAKAGVEDVEREFDELAERGHVLGKREIEQWPDGTVSACYGFAHRFFQQVLYERLGDAHRVRVHRLIGERKEAAYGSRAAEIAGELALHFECGRDHRRATHYHWEAAETALRRNAYREAAAHLRSALTQLGELPADSDRDQRELVLQATLARSLQRLEGPAAPDCESAYARALELCQQDGVETPQLVPVLLGLHTSQFAQGDLDDAAVLVERAMRTAQAAKNSDLLAQAHAAVGSANYWKGEIAQAREHLEQSVALAGSSSPRSRFELMYAFDQRVRSLSTLALILEVQGYADQALARVQEALALAAESASPFDLCSTHVLNAVVHQFRGDAPATQANAEAAGELGKAHGFVLFSALAEMLRGWALADGGEVASGIDVMQEALEELRKTGVRIILPHFLAVLAEVYGDSGRTEEGRRLLSEAREIANAGVHLHDAEIQRLAAELSLPPTAPRSARPGTAAAAGSGDAERLLQDACETARRQQAKAWELRAATSLSRLWHSQGKRQEARILLTDTVGWFTEGFTTSDLRAAKALLATLATER
jgi:DNA-binding winged helix-turn-helix (wHTH) protein/predicted ATPase